MDTTKITTFYAHQKKSTSANNNDIKRLKRKNSLKKAEILQCTVKSVGSKSPVARNTRSSTRAKLKTTLTRQSSKINDFFKSHTDVSDKKNVTLVNNEDEDNFVTSSSSATILEKKNSDSTEVSHEQKSSPGFITPIKSPLNLSSQKRRYNETVSLSGHVKNFTPELSITDEKNESTLQKSRSVRKKLSLGDDDYMKGETKFIEDAIKKQKNVSIFHFVFWAMVLVIS